MINTMFDTISNMKRSIRTIYGDSDLTYGHKSMKLHGILQGHGAGPTIWIMISSPMLNHLREKGLGVKIKLTDGNELIITAFAFVDDINLIKEMTEGNNDMV
jgi:hypothetical protein